MARHFFIQLTRTLAGVAGGLLRSSRSEAGMAGTAIGMVSFALSGGIFATTLVNNGTLSAERLGFVMQQSLDRVSGSLEVRGAVVVTAKGAPLANDTIQFSLGSFGRLPPIPMDPAEPGGLVISYRDTQAVATNVPYTARFTSAANAGEVLDEGEVATISIKVADLQALAGQAVLPPGKRWTLDLTTANGAALEFTRTQPSVLTPVMAQR